MSPAKIRYQPSTSQAKAFDLSSPDKTTEDTENDVFPSGKKYPVIVETPTKQRKDGRLPFKPLAMPVGSPQTHPSMVPKVGESYLSILALDEEFAIMHFWETLKTVLC